MIRHPLQRRLLVGLLALYGLVSALMPFAHTHGPLATGGSPSGIDLAAYALPDGSLPVLCLPGSGTGDKDGSRDGPCLACLLIHSGGLEPSPAVAIARAYELRPIAHLAIEIPRRVAHQHRDAARPRAPPHA